MNAKRRLKKLPEQVGESVAQQGKRTVPLMFQDEARFGRINDPKRCWAPRGIRPNVQAQIVREYTYVFGAVCPHDGTLDTLILPEVNTAAMSLFLAEVGKRHANDTILMVLDGAGWPRARALRVPENIHLLSLPPYSPQLNPMEHLWDDIREKWFPNLIFDSLDALETHLNHALIAYEDNPTLVASTTGFDWIINNCMNAT